ncbi:MAG: metallophosphoesterase [Clostridia bacterium]|nr:metallophosphoesterase [Clostridia bacterium]
MAKKIVIVIFLALLIIAVIIGGIFLFLKLRPQTIKVQPAVFETGTENYCILFESSLKGSGYVKYTYNGEEKTVWDATSGIIATHDTVHKILVPKNELINNTYVVGAQHVPFKFAYTAQKGDVCESEPIHFRGEEKEDNIKILAITDIHEMEEDVKKAVSFFEDDSDIVVMLGDITSNFEKKEKFTDHILTDAAFLSKGEIPVVYTRGNHETRGEFASQLLSYFPTETGEFYYTFDFGALSACVLDAGEDKDDSHEEYSGLIDFSSYRKKQFNWINSLKAADFTGKYKIVFCHFPLIDDHFGMNWMTPLKEKGFTLIVGGHHHKSELFEREITAFDACGKYKDGWAASSITLSKGNIELLTINSKGETVLSETLKAE